MYFGASSRYNERAKLYYNLYKRLTTVQERVLIKLSTRQKKKQPDNKKQPKRTGFIEFKGIRLAFPQIQGVYIGV